MKFISFVLAFICQVYLVVSYESNRRQLESSPLFVSSSTHLKYYVPCHEDIKSLPLSEPLFPDADILYQDGENCDDLENKALDIYFLSLNKEDLNSSSNGSKNVCGLKFLTINCPFTNVISVNLMRSFVNLSDNSIESLNFDGETVHDGPVVEDGEVNYAEINQGSMNIKTGRDDGEGNYISNTDFLFYGVKFSEVSESMYIKYFKNMVMKYFCISDTNNQNVAKIVESVFDIKRGRNMFWESFKLQNNQFVNQFIFKVMNIEHVSFIQGNYVYLEGNKVFDKTSSVVDIYGSEWIRMKHVKIINNHSKQGHCNGFWITKTDNLVIQDTYAAGNTILDRFGNVGKLYINSVKKAVIVDLISRNNRNFDEYQQNSHTIFCDNSNIYLRNITIEDNYEASILAVGANLTIHDSVIQNNIHPFQKGCFLFLGNDKIEVYNTIFKNNTGESSSLSIGNIYRDKVNKIKYINVTNCLFEGNHFKENDLKIDFHNGPSPMGKYLKNLTFVRDTSNDNIAVMALQIVDSIDIQDILFKNMESIPNAMVIYESFNVTVKNIEFRDINFREGNGVMKMNSVSDSKVENIFFKNIKTPLNSPGLYIQSCSQLEFKNITFLNLEAQGIAGAGSITLSDNILFEDVFIQNCKARQTGGFEITQVKNSQFKNLKIENNFAQQLCAGLYIASGESLTFENVVIKDNEAGIENGGLYCKLSSSVTFKGLSLKRNKAPEIGAMFLDNNKDFKLEDAEIEDNVSSQGAGMFGQFNNGLDILNSNFKKNSAADIGGGIFMTQSWKIKIKKSNFTENYTKKKGAGLYLDNIDSVTFENNYISQNNADQGAGIMIENCESFHVLNTTILENTASSFGGGILAISDQDILLQDSLVTSNSGKEGGGLYVAQHSQKVEVQVKIIRCKIQDNGADLSGGFLSGKKIESIVVEDSNFQNNTCLLNGGAMSVMDCSTISVMESSFSDHTSVNGGSFFLQTIKQVKIENTFFRNNSAEIQGGSIYYKGVDSVEIRKTRFVGNQIKENQQQLQIEQDLSGGTLYGSSSKHFEAWKVTVENSHASFQGGGVFLQNIDDLIFQECNFQNNNVKVEKNVISQGGCVYIEQLEKSPSKQQRIQIQKNKFVKCQSSSGGGIFLHDNSEDNGVKLSLQDNVFSENEAYIGPSMRILQRTPSFKQKSEDQNSFSQNIGIFDDIEIYFHYYRNERLIDESKSMQYTLCTPGSYLNNAQAGSPECQKCILNAQCEGGYIHMYPIENFWRTDIDSIQLYQCLDEGKCLKNDKCSPGYKGVVCDLCQLQLSYRRNEKNFCQKCNDTEIVYLNLIGFFILLLIFQAIQISGVNTKIDLKMMTDALKVIFKYNVINKKILPVVMKIFLLHVQVLYFSSIVKFDFSHSIEVGIKIFGSQVEAFTKEMQCLTENPESEEEEERFQFNAYMYSFIYNFGLLVVQYLVILVLYLVKKLDETKIKGSLVQAFVAFFIFSQPGIIQTSIQYLSCREIAGSYFSKGDVGINCSGDFYQETILPVFISMAFIYGIAIPLFLIFRLIQAHNQMQLQTTKYLRSYGQMTLEYKETAFFWEIVDIILKMSVASISIIFENEKLIHGLLVVFCLIVYHYMLLKFQPFNNMKTNKIAIVGNIVQIMTILLGVINIFLDQEKLFEDLKVFIQVLIMLINGFYFLALGYEVAKKDVMVQVKEAFLSSKKQASGPITKKISHKINMEKKAKFYWRSLAKGLQQYLKETHTFEQNNQYKDALITSLNTTMKMSNVRGNKKQREFMKDFLHIKDDDINPEFETQGSQIHESNMISMKESLTTSKMLLRAGSISPLKYNSSPFKNEKMQKLNLEKTEETTNYMEKTD